MKASAGFIATKAGKQFRSTGPGIDVTLHCSIRNIGTIFSKSFVKSAAFYYWGLLDRIQASSAIQQDSEMTLF
jgi:hypothetical protein